MSKFILDENIFVTLFTKIKNLIINKADKNLTNVEASDFKTAYENSGANGIPIVTTGGTSTAYTATVPGITELEIGMKITIIPHVSNGSNATLNINNLGALSIVQNYTSNSSYVAISYNTMYQNKPATLVCNGTYWVFTDINKINYNSIEGTIPISKGGTGQTTASAALTNLGGVSKTTTEDISGVKTFTNGLKSKKPIEVIKPDDTNQYTEITHSDIIFRSDMVSSSSDTGSAGGSIIEDCVAGIGFMDNTTDTPSVFTCDETSSNPIKELTPLNVGEPTVDNNAATKKYVDDNKVEQTSWYGTCNTGNNPTEKIVITTTKDFKLKIGNRISVKFTNYNTASPAKLNVDNTGAKPIANYGSNTVQTYAWYNGEIVDFIYDGTNFILVDGMFATTTYYGVTKLSSSVTSTATQIAATPSAVKKAYDHATDAVDYADEAYALALTKVDGSVKITNTLTANNWHGNIYTFSNSDITAANVIELYPDPSITEEQLEALQEANIIGGTQSAGSCELIAKGDVPTIDIPVKIVVRKDI